MGTLARHRSRMTDNALLNWAALAISFFNAMLLVWLGLTVLLNSDRRRWGIWIAGGGMLLGAAFFASHSVLLGLGLRNLGWDTTIFWWAIGLLSAISLPFLWYVIMLWYAGYWEDPTSRLHRRQRPWFILTAALLLLGVAGIISATISLGIGSPNFGQWFLYLRFSASGIPLMVIGFSFYMLLSIALALDALRHPGPSARVMGNLARRRARPWLAAASIALFFIAVIVTAALFWVGRLSRELLLFEVYRQTGTALGLLDLLVSLLISLVIILLGQAIVSYEVFTGRTLPRRGLRRQWQRALLLAAGSSALAAAAVTLDIRPIYGLLLAVLLMILFYALVSWRSYVERENLMDSLRPFVASQGLYDRLLAPATPLAGDLSAPFNALCHDLLDAQRAYLVAAGPVATFVEQPLIYPPGTAVTLPALETLLPNFAAPQAEPLAIDPALYAGALWAIPLWSERGLNGVLLLGEKRGGGLYTREEMEIAAITGERLIDTQAGAEMSRRLMRLQRQHMTQTQVVDQQTRRVLHDEILPDLHAALISLNAGDNGPAENKALLDLLAGTHRQIADLLHALPAAAAPEVERLGLIEALRRTVEQEYAAAFDAVQWQVDPAAQEQLAQMPSLPAGVIYYAAREAVRNAAKYGRPANPEQPFTLTLIVGQVSYLSSSLLATPPPIGQVSYLSSSPLAANPPIAQPSPLSSGGQGENLSYNGTQYELIIHDNGRGLPTAETPTPNGGQGLALHSTMMAIIGGTLSVSSAAGQGTRVVLAFPGS